jgi:uncharacterized membrane protein
LKPGSSALFVLVSGSHATATLSALRPYHGTLYQTTLPSDLEAQLREALK